MRLQNVRLEWSAAYRSQFLDSGFIYPYILPQEAYWELTHLDRPILYFIWMKMKNLCSDARIW
jgi:hypothetical protein